MQWYQPACYSYVASSNILFSFSIRAIFSANSASISSHTDYDNELIWWAHSLCAVLGIHVAMSVCDTGVALDEQIRHPEDQCSHFDRIERLHHSIDRALYSLAELLALYNQDYGEEDLHLVGDSGKYNLNKMELLQNKRIDLSAKFHDFHIFSYKLKCVLTSISILGCWFFTIVYNSWYRTAIVKSADRRRPNDGC